MSPISSIGRSTQIYADVAGLGIHNCNIHGLFEGDELFEENLVGDLYEQVSILRGGIREPIAHLPMNTTNKCPRCAEQGIEQFVLPGKHCPRCNQPC